jgi:hypothetical protein
MKIVIEQGLRRNRKRSSVPKILGIIEAAPN